MENEQKENKRTFGEFAKSVLLSSPFTPISINLNLSRQLLNQSQKK
jgi:hypothetical protein